VDRSLRVSLIKTLLTLLPFCSVGPRDASPANLLLAAVFTESATSKEQPLHYVRVEGRRDLLRYHESIQAK